ncbi:sulfite exporter TauE/SafE family protein [Brevibacterium album]|uniref:sulfite exporter TauE/SafE family protein n=1 Tax=Brevibacterium album TaxID=417948 RepID=UPI000412A42B|nr:sulfite exporter TauE/SafE family protein [Brevibacterium album]
MQLVIALILLAVLVGALAQRITGMGFALVSGPFLVLLLEPVPGVVLVNLCGLVSSIIVLWRTHREVEWKLSACLAAGGLVGTFPGAMLAVALPAHALEILIGVLVVAALATSLLLGRLLTRPLARRRGGAVAAGLASGAMNSAAGIGGPALSSFAVLTRWDQRAFAASIQPVFVVMATFAVASKLLLDHSAWPALSPGTWLMILAALVLGQLLGEWLSRFTPVSTARTGMLTLAFLGGLLTIGRGLGLF